MTGPDLIHFDEQKRVAAYERMVRRIRATLLGIFAQQSYADDLTMEALAARISREPRWVWRRLIGPVVPTLSDISDIAIGMGCEIEFRVVRREEQL
mgnify:FL=1